MLCGLSGINFAYGFLFINAKYSSGAGIVEVAPPYDACLSSRSSFLNTKLADITGIVAVDIVMMS